MTSKSGGHDVRERGRRGHRILKGRALSASRINPPKKFAENPTLKAEESYQQNKEQKVKVSENSFNTTSSGGRGGQEAIFGASLLRQLLEKRLAKKLADQNDREHGAGTGKDGKEDDKKACDISFKPTSNVGCGGQKDLQLKKVADKLALLGDSCPNPSEKFADQNNNGGIENSLENQDNHAEFSSKEAGDFARVNHKGFSSIDDQKFQANRSNSSDDAQLRENVEIFRRAFGESHYFVANYNQEAKRGREGIFSKDKRQPEPCEGPKEKAGIFRESKEEEFQEGNVDIFRKAFGDDHYFVKTGREGCFNKDERQSMRRFGKENRPKSIRGCDGQKDSQFEKVAEKLALPGDSHPNSAKKFTDQNNNADKFRENDAGNKASMTSRIGGHIARHDVDKRSRKFFSRVSQEGISSKVGYSFGGHAKTYAQSVKSSEYVQKVDFARTQYARVPDTLLPFAVYIEKLDISNSKVKLKLSGKEYLTIRTELINAFMRESQDTQVLLVNEFEKRVFNSERGFATFYTKSKFAQDFTIRVINEKLSSQGITARGPRSELRPNLHVIFPLVLTKVQAKPVDIIKEAILLNAKTDCNPIIITDRPNPKSKGRILSCVLPEDKLGEFQSWARKNNAKKLALFTESLPFWTSKKTVQTASVPEVADAVMVPNATPEELSKNNLEEVADSTPVVVPILISKELSKNNLEEIVEVTDAPVGAQRDFVTTETEISDFTPGVPILIPKESSKNNAESPQKTLDESVKATDTPEGAGGTKKTSDESLEATDDPEGAQGTTTIDTDAVKAEVTKVAKATKVAKVIKVIKAKSARKKGAYQTSPGSSIAKNRPKRACTLKRTTLGQPMVVASRKVSRNSSVSQKRMSDYFPQK